MFGHPDDMEGILLRQRGEIASILGFQHSFVTIVADVFKCFVCCQVEEI